MPRFSIIITCYNQRDIITEAIDSALGQNCSDREVIVVDDCSTDSSAPLLKKYGGAITLATLPHNQGAPGARNHGAALAQGDYLVFLDGDDRLFPWALDVYSRVVESDQPKLLLATMQYFSEHLPPAASNDTPREITVARYDDYFSKDRAYRASASAMIVQRQSFNDVAGWSDGTFPADDQDLLFKLGCSGATVQIISPETSAYRIHPSNATRSVLPLVNACHLLLRNEQSGRYPGGRKRRFSRHAVIGGFVFFLVKRAVQNRHFSAGFSLFAAGWSMIGSAILRRGFSLLRGNRPVETLVE